MKNSLLYYLLHLLFFLLGNALIVWTIIWKYAKKHIFSNVRPNSRICHRREITFDSEQGCGSRRKLCLIIFDWQVWTRPSPKGTFGGLAPPNTAPSPPKLNYEAYKSMKFLSHFRMSSPPPLNKRKAPLLNTFWRRFWSGRVG